jgi:GNAT superfamily N-acetyltransferase
VDAVLDLDAGRFTRRPLRVGVAGQPADELVLRPIDAGDEQFLHDLYAETRAEELTVVDWSDEQRRSFCDTQFDLQDAYYRREFPGATFDVIECGGRPVGRLLVALDTPRCEVLDITLAPEHRGIGLGTLLLHWVQTAAATLSVPVVLWVAHHSSARHLYERLGFMAVEQDEFNVLMMWQHEAIGSSAWVRFESLALHDAELRERLASAADDVELAINAVSLGLNRHLSFGTDDVLRALRANRRAWIERGLA